METNKYSIPFNEKIIELIHDAELLLGKKITNEININDNLHYFHTRIIINDLSMEIYKINKESRNKTLDLFKLTENHEFYCSTKIIEINNLYKQCLEKPTQYLSESIRDKYNDLEYMNKLYREDYIKINDEIEKLNEKKIYLQNKCVEMDSEIESVVIVTNTCYKINQSTNQLTN